MNVPQNVLMKVRLLHVLELSTRAIRVANNLGGEKGTSNFNSLLILSSSFLPQPAVNILIERFDHHAQLTAPFADFMHCDDQQGKQANHPAHGEKNDFVPLSL